MNRNTSAAVADRITETVAINVRPARAAAGYVAGSNRCRRGRRFRQVRPEMHTKGTMLTEHNFLGYQSLGSLIRFELTFFNPM